MSEKSGSGKVKGGHNLIDEVVDIIVLNSS